MTEIKPAAFISNDAKLPLVEDGQYWLYEKQGDCLVALYPADVVEALQTENFDLKLKVEVYEAGIKLLEKVKQENAAQAKRIEELEAPSNPYDRVDLQGKLYIAGLQNQIESLRKQVEMLLGSARKTVLALAHASIHDPLYTAAYDELSESIKLASKNGE